MATGDAASTKLDSTITSAAVEGSDQHFANHSFHIHNPQHTARSEGACAFLAALAYNLVDSI